MASCWENAAPCSAGSAETPRHPANLTRIRFTPDGKGFVLGERGALLRWIG